ncbi:MAG: hypothetical protein DI539_12200 [Flavobacterium psychrophilum]|nr:MAG: hypothetical protein DI539_12200 [Flavobacterium psychrophilum]
MAVVFNSTNFRKLLITQPWDAFEDLFNHFQIPLIRVAIRFSHDKDAAEDIVQDTFAQLWKAQKNMIRSPKRSVENYVARCVQYNAMLHRKRRLHESLDVVSLYQEFVADDDTVQSLIEKELYADFRKFIDTLPPRQKECLEMKIDNDMSLDEIALKLGIVRKTVELSQTIARKKLTQWASRYDI